VAGVTKVDGQMIQSPAHVDAQALVQVLAAVQVHRHSIVPGIDPLLVHRLCGYVGQQHLRGLHVGPEAVQLGAQVVVHARSLSCCSGRLHDDRKPARPQGGPAEGVDMSVYSVGEIADKINQRARELAPELLPNGRYSQCRSKWMFSGIEDHGKSESAWVHLTGPKTGKWFDMGNAAPGEDKGDMLDLLRLKLGLADARAAIEEAKGRLGLVDQWKPGKPAELSPAEREARAAEARERAARRQAELEEEDAKARKNAKRLYLRGSPAIAGTPAEAYLLGRGLEAGGRWPGVLRYHAEVYNTEIQRKAPAMLAAVYRADGEQIGTHRTWLQRAPQGWGKLQVAKPKKVLGRLRGGFIPINKGSSGKSMRDMPAGEPIYVTEGVEDALVVRMMKPEARVIAAYSLGNVGALVLPEAARRLVIVADRDTGEREQELLERTIAQQQARGIEVRLVVPPEQVNGVAVKDMNDWWQALQAQKRGVA
jgi:hypothetical protein